MTNRLPGSEDAYDRIVTEIIGRATNHLPDDDRYRLGLFFLAQVLYPRYASAAAACSGDSPITAGRLFLQQPGNVPNEIALLIDEMPNLPDPSDPE